MRIKALQRFCQTKRMISLVNFPGIGENDSLNGKSGEDVHRLVRALGF